MILRWRHETRRRPQNEFRFNAHATGLPWVPFTGNGSIRCSRGRLNTCVRATAGMGKLPERQGVPPRKASVRERHPTCAACASQRRSRGSQGFCGLSYQTSKVRFTLKGCAQFRGRYLSHMQAKDLVETALPWVGALSIIVASITVSAKKLTQFVGELRNFVHAAKGLALDVFEALALIKKTPS